MTRTIVCLYYRQLTDSSNKANWNKNISIGMGIQMQRKDFLIIFKM